MGGGTAPDPGGSDPGAGETGALGVPGLVDIAAGLLDAAAVDFRAGVGAPPSLTKSGPEDFATEVDLAIERRLAAELPAATGIAVHGEEYGGPPVDEGRVWVLDPVDGTANYSAGLPMTGILLALLDGGVPAAGLIWLPLLGRRLHAVAGGPLIVDGRTAEPLPAGRLRSSTVGLGSLRGFSRGRFPGAYRMALTTQISGRAARSRAAGSIGFDLAQVALGSYGGAYSYGNHPWDNAAGACLVAAAGGTVTDLAGEPWTLHSDSLLAAAPGVHGELLEAIADAGPRR